MSDAETRRFVSGDSLPLENTTREGHASRNTGAVDVLMAVTQLPGDEVEVKMQLELLCDMDFTYRREPLYDNLFKYVVPYGTNEAGLYGEGDAVFRGERLSGTARFVNHATRRSDGVNLP